MPSNSRFQKGSGAYQCCECRRLTRETGEGESQSNMCRACFLDNQQLNYEIDHIDNANGAEIGEAYKRYEEKVMKRRVKK